MTRILVFVNSFNLGGITSLLQDIYRNLDRSRFSMSFIRPDRNRNAFDEEVKANGDFVFYYENESLGQIPVVNYTIRKHHMVKKVCNALKDAPAFDVAYIHSNHSYCLPAAKKLKIPKIVMHTHEAVSDFNGNEEKSTLIRYIWNRRVKMYNRLADYKLGDSQKACIAKFGPQVIHDPAMQVIHPPINMEKFNPTAYDRAAALAQFHIDPEKINLVHIGRLCGVKNQPFLIDVLSSVLQTKAAHLYIVGDGEAQKQALIAYAKEKGVLEHICFLPGNTNIPLLLTAMDISLLPSFSEAFGMVAVESQLMGVPCIASANVPKDVDVGMCRFLPIDQGAQDWADTIVENAWGQLLPEKRKQFEIGYILEQLSAIFSQ